jgi:hypothetical protein
MWQASLLRWLIDSFTSMIVLLGTAVVFAALQRRHASGWLVRACFAGGWSNVIVVWRTSSVEDVT